MARYDNILSTAKNAVRTVWKTIWLIKDDETTTQQTTTPITTQPNIQTETLSWGQSSFSANPKTNVQRNIESNLDKWFLNQWDIETTWTKATTESSLYDTAKEVWESIKWVWTAFEKNFSFNNEKKRFILWVWDSFFTKDSPIELNLRWWDDNEIFNKALSIYQKDWDIDKLYDSVKDSFEAKPVHWQFSVWRFSAMMQAWKSMWKIKSWDYKITKNQLKDYLDMISENEEIWQKYWITSENEEDDWLIKLSDNTKNKHNTAYVAWAEEWIIDTLKQTKLSGTARDIALTGVSSAIRSQVERTSEHTLPVFDIEQQVLAKDKSTWTDVDKKVINYANMLRSLEWMYAKNLNRWWKETLLYWTDDDWQLRDALVWFTNWDSLNTVLTWNLKEAVKKLWYDDFGKHDSAIDIFSKLAEDITYEYKQSNTSWMLRRWWSAFMHASDWVDRQLWERWWQWLIWWHTSWAYWQYIDNDFTVWWIIDTTDSQTMRTIKKYWANVLEYAWETIWAFVPEIGTAALSAFAAPLTWWWSLWLWLMKVAPKVVSGFRKVSKYTDNISKFTKATKYIDFVKDNVPAVWKTVKAISDVVEEYPTVDKWLKFLNQTIRKWWKEALYWMTIDARLNPYDTERYSDMSYYSSIVWSIATDIIPAVWSSWKRLLSYNKLIDWLWKVSISDAIDWLAFDKKNLAWILSWLTWREVKEEDVSSVVKALYWVEWAMTKTYNEMSSEWKRIFDNYIKNIIWWTIINKVWANATEAKNIMSLIQNPYTNMADVIKYAYKMPEDLQIWPYISKIKLKNWTDASVIWKSTVDWTQKKNILSIEWWIKNKLVRWFTDNDIARLGKLWDWTFKEMVEDKTWKYFTQVWDRKFLTSEWYDKLWLELSNESLSSIGISLAKAEDTKELFKTKMKWLKWNKLSDETIDMVAESWAYDEVVSKISEILC